MFIRTVTPCQIECISPSRVSAVMLERTSRIYNWPAPRAWCNSHDSLFTLHLLSNFPAASGRASATPAHRPPSTQSDRTSQIIRPLTDLFYLYIKQLSSTTLAFANILSVHLLNTSIASIVRIRRLSPWEFCNTIIVLHTVWMIHLGNYIQYNRNGDFFERAFSGKAVI